MRNEKTPIFDAAKDLVLGYAVLLLSFVVFCALLCAVIIVVRVIAG